MVGISDIAKMYVNEMQTGQLGSATSLMERLKGVCYEKTGGALSGVDVEAILSGMESEFNRLYSGGLIKEADNKEYLELVQQVMQHFRKERE